ncbi:MAG: TlpA family protein disulfide reductase [Anaerolineaceae bacterium]|nr:TlpA family protein disulfide reductase [Anaerolineaceae bacterium]
MTETPPPSTVQASRPSPVLVLFLIFPLLGIVAAIITALNDPGLANTVPATPLPVTVEFKTLVDQPAPNFELASLEGNAAKLSNYRGRVVFLNFWATWCEPCQRELPTFQGFMAEQGEIGPVILTVNISDSPNQITDYFQEHGIADIPTLLDFNLTVYEDYAISQLPTTFVIDAGGVVRYRHIGEMTADDLQAYVEALTQTS